MGPGQFSTQCVEFPVARVLCRKGKVKLAEIPEITLREPLTKLLAQADGQILDQRALLRNFSFRQINCADTTKCTLCVT